MTLRDEIKIIEQRLIMDADYAKKREAEMAAIGYECSESFSRAEHVCKAQIACWLRRAMDRTKGGAE